MRRIKIILITSLFVITVLLLGFRFEVEIHNAKMVPPVQMCIGSIRVNLPSMGEVLVNAHIFNDSISGRFAMTYSHSITRLDNNWQIESVTAYHHPGWDFKRVSVEIVFIRNNTRIYEPAWISANNCSFVDYMPSSFIISGFG